MKKLLLATVAFLGLVGTVDRASALSISSVALSPTDTGFGPVGTTLTGSVYYGLTADQSVSANLVAKDPFGTGPGSYDSVEGGADAFFSASAFGLDGSTGTFKFIYGSPDTYNYLFFYNGGTLVNTLVGAAGIGGVGATGSGAFVTTISGIGAYDTVAFGSTSNAFEFAAVSAVPLPASFPLFGGALLVLAGFSYGMNRWVAPRAKISAAA